MRVVHLGVEEFEAAGTQVGDEVDEADFAGVRAAEFGAGEHGFAAEDRADGEAVEPADESRPGVGVQPGLDAVGVAGAVEEVEEGDDGAVEPGLFAARTRGGTLADDAVEGAVGGDLEAARADARGERARDAEAVVEGDEGAAGGLNPLDLRRVGVGHGEPALGVEGEGLGDGGLFAGRQAGGGSGHGGLLPAGGVGRDAGGSGERAWYAFP